jgi:hypothetical protein
VVFEGGECWANEGGEVAWVCSDLVVLTPPFLSYPASSGLWPALPLGLTKQINYPSSSHHHHHYPTKLYELFNGSAYFHGPTYIKQSRQNGRLNIFFSTGNRLELKYEPFISL